MVFPNTSSSVTFLRYVMGQNFLLLKGTKMMKDDPEISHIPTLLLTAKTDEDSKNIGFEVGDWDYISKPFNANDLSNKIENIIDTRNHFKSFILKQHISPEIKQHYTPFDQQLISKIKKIILENIGASTYTVEAFAKEIGFSRMQLHRKLKTLTGQSTTKFINTIKITHAPIYLKVVWTEFRKLWMP